MPIQDFILYIYILSCSSCLQLIISIVEDLGKQDEKLGDLIWCAQELDLFSDVQGGTAVR